MSNCLDPDHDRHSVGPDLGPNCLQRLSADDKKVAASKEEVKRTYQYNSGATQEAVLVIQEAMFCDLYQFK